MANPQDVLFSGGRGQGWDRLTVLMAHDLYDLTQHPPRSPRVRLGGLVILPRMIDKARATKAGKNGEYNYACPLDANVLDFLGVEANALKAQIDNGLGDGEILVWLMANAKKPRTAQEIAAFSAFHEQRAPSSPASRAKMTDYQSSTPAGAKRDDITTWFDVLDLDDHQSFGGKV